MKIQNNTNVIFNKFKEKNYNFVIEKTNFLSEKENNNDQTFQDNKHNINYLENKFMKQFEND